MIKSNENFERGSLGVAWINSTSEKLDCSVSHRVMAFITFLISPSLITAIHQRPVKSSNEERCRNLRRLEI